MTCIHLAYGDIRDAEKRYVEITESSAGELTAQSVHLRNLLVIDQKKFVARVFASALGLTLIDFDKWVSTAAVLLIVKDFVGLRVKDFSQIESNVLYAVYITCAPDRFYFTQNAIAQSYTHLFGDISNEILKSVLRYLEELHIIVNEEIRYALRQEIRLESHRS